MTRCHWNICNDILSFLNDIRERYTFCFIFSCNYLSLYVNWLFHTKIRLMFFSYVLESFTASRSSFCCEKKHLIGLKNHFSKSSYILSYFSYIAPGELEFQSEFKFVINIISYLIKLSDKFMLHVRAWIYTTEYK